jgi:hypothetical protein
VTPFQYSSFISRLPDFALRLFFHHGVSRGPRRGCARRSGDQGWNSSVFDFVNSYYEQVSPIIRTFKGFIVKYMGDGIMAVFPNRADDALQAAITKQQCVAEYNEHRLKKGKSLSMHRSSFIKF